MNNCTTSQYCSFLNEFISFKYIQIHRNDYIGSITKLKSSSKTKGTKMRTQKMQQKKTDEDYKLHD